MKNLIKSKAKKGFSLVELLVVIAVIGIIAAIAIPAMSGIFGEATTTTNKRNAQNIAGVVAAARAAGNTTVTNDAAGVKLITHGTVSGAGAFAGATFGTKMINTDAQAASVYLDPSLSYVPSGAQTALVITPP